MQFPCALFNQRSLSVKQFVVHKLQYCYPMLCANMLKASIINTEEDPIYAGKQLFMRTCCILGPSKNREASEALIRLLGLCCVRFRSAFFGFAKISVQTFPTLEHSKCTKSVCGSCDSGKFFNLLQFFFSFFVELMAYKNVCFFASTDMQCWETSHLCV